jgi:hypothetical protein
MGAGW